MSESQPTMKMPWTRCLRWWLAMRVMSQEDKVSLLGMARYIKAREEIRVAMEQAMMAAIKGQEVVSKVPAPPLDPRRN